MPSASDALRKLAWSARASTCRYCRNSTRSLPGYRGDNLWKNQDASPLAIPFAPVYQVSKRGLVPSVANLEELFANAAKPGGELKLWDVTTGRTVSTLERILVSVVFSEGADIGVRCLFGAKRHLTPISPQLTPISPL